MIRLSDRALVSIIIVSLVLLIIILSSFYVEYPPVGDITGWDGVEVSQTSEGLMFEPTGHDSGTVYLNGEEIGSYNDGMAYNLDYKEENIRIGDTVTIKNSQGEQIHEVVLTSQIVDLERATFSFTGIEHEEDLTVNESLTINATVENNGELPGDQNVSFMVDEKVEHSETVTLLAGESKTITVSQTFSNVGSQPISFESLNDSITSSVKVLERPPLFEITEDNIDTQIRTDQDFTVNATIENTGGQEGSQTISFVFNGEEISTTSLDLDEGENEIVEFTHTAPSEEGDYNYSILTEDTTINRTVNVEYYGPYFEVKEIISPIVLYDGETLTISGIIENTGDVSGTNIVEFKFDGTLQSTKVVTIDPGEEREVTFKHTYPLTPGDYTQTISTEKDKKTMDITVEAVNPEIIINNIQGLEDGTNETYYEPDISITEENNVNPEGVTIELSIQDSNGNPVFGDEIQVALSAGGTESESFDIGTLEDDTYEYTIEAYSAESNVDTVTGSFKVG